MDIFGRLETNSLHKLHSHDLKLSFCSDVISNWCPSPDFRLFDKANS